MTSGFDTANEFYFYDMMYESSDWDDAVEQEHERERKHFCEEQAIEERLAAEYEDDGQPEFAQEYESTEDVYAEQEAEVGDE